ncbi:MAG: nucleotide sugar dehydrogenase, partial [Chloroflexia bacterium]|nr:nucleotide sugar dehydrogenase [Chloroflexia bacterium]
VDPYYLAQAAQRHGYNPEIILAGRRMNDSMGEYVADQVVKLMLRKGIQVLGSRVLLLGFTFKENCPDVRNTRVIDIIRTLEEYNVQVTIHDPWAHPHVARREYGVEIVNSLPAERYDALILAVAHNAFRNIDVNSILNEPGVAYDVKGLLPADVVDGKL